MESHHNLPNWVRKIKDHLTRSGSSSVDLVVGKKRVKLSSEDLDHPENEEVSELESMAKNARASRVK